MGPKIKYFFTADNAFIDEQVGKLSASGFFDTLITPVFPFKGPKFYIVIGLIQVEGSMEVLLKINQPDGKEVGESIGIVNPRSINDTVNVIIATEDMPLHQEGVYSFCVYDRKNMELLGSYFVNVNYPPQRVFKEGEAEDILSNPDLIKGALVRIKCEKCSAEYKLSLHLDKNKPAPEGHIPFPEGDMLDCCEDNKIELIGIRRQLEWEFGKPKPAQQEEVQL